MPVASSTRYVGSRQIIKRYRGSTLIWESGDPQPDIQPDAFDFPDRTDAVRSTSYTSDWMPITGIDEAVSISVVGGQYQIADDASGTNASALTSDAGTITSGKYVRVQGTSSAEYETPVHVDLTVGGGTGRFTITTVAEAVETTPLTIDTVPGVNGETEFTYTPGDGGDVTNQTLSSPDGRLGTATFAASPEGPQPLNDPAIDDADTAPGATITFTPPDLDADDMEAVSQSWQWFVGGEETGETGFTFNRPNSEQAITIVYSATDATGTFGTDYGPVATTVLPPLPAPDVTDDSTDIVVEGSKTLNILDNDTDSNEDDLVVLSLEFQSGAAEGIVESWEADGTVTLNATGFAAGDYVYQATISNGGPNTSTQLLTISVVAVATISIGTAQAEALTYDEHCFEQDIDGVGVLQNHPDNDTSGTVRAIWNGGDGIHNITTNFRDDIHGENSSITLRVNGVPVETISFPSLQNAFIDHVTSNVDLVNGDEISWLLNAQRDSNGDPVWCAFNSATLALVGDISTDQTTPRVFVSTDMVGGDKDDAQSYIHMMLSLDRIDYRGTVSTKTPIADVDFDTYHNAIMDAYATDLPDIEASTGTTFPTRAAIDAITYEGSDYPSVWADRGGAVVPAGVQAMVDEAALASPTDPLYLLVWGDIYDVAWALDLMPSGSIANVRVISIIASSQGADNGTAAYDWMRVEVADPASKLRELWWIDMTTTFRGMYVTSTGGNDPAHSDNMTFINTHIAGHGALGALFDTYSEDLYPLDANTNPGLKMGDTPSLMYLFAAQHGADLDDPTDLTNWGGAFELDPAAGPNCYRDIQSGYTLGTNPAYPGANTVRQHRAAAWGDMEALFDRALPANPIEVGRTQAESLALTNYTVETLGTDALGQSPDGDMITADAGATGTASGTFMGADGTYNINVRYLADSDNGATFEVVVDDVVVDSRTTAGMAQNELTTYTVSGVELQNGSTITLRGTAVGGDFARIDWLEVETPPSAGYTETPLKLYGGNDVYWTYNLASTDGPDLLLFFSTLWDGRSGATLFGWSLDNYLMSGGDSLRFVHKGGGGTSFADFATGLTAGVRTHGIIRCGTQGAGLRYNLSTQQAGEAWVDHAAVDLADRTQIDFTSGQVRLGGRTNGSERWDGWAYRVACWAASGAAPAIDQDLKDSFIDPVDQALKDPSVSHAFVGLGTPRMEIHTRDAGFVPFNSGLNGNGSRGENGTWGE